MRRHLGTIFIVLILLAGLSLLLYPTASDYWNRLHQSAAIVEYAEKVNALDNETFQAMWDEAVHYNELLYESHRGVDIEEMPDYYSVLDVTGDGMMSFIDIPKINCHLPIYHGTDEGVLQSNTGHLETSSLPVGGISTHCVLSGHRGLPSARLFTDLDQIVEGDTFTLTTLGVVLTYEVDQILVVLPQEVNSIGITPGEDYCTLVTCTPYGVNSHRLLIRGHRVETPEEETAENRDPAAEQTHIEPLYIIVHNCVQICLRQ